MRVRTVRLDDQQAACVALPDGRLARVDRILPGAPPDLLTLLEAGALAALADAVAAGVDDVACVDPRSPVVAPWTRPRKILGIGLNSGAHAGDLGEQAPRTSPARLGGGRAQSNRAVARSAPVRSARSFSHTRLGATSPIPAVVSKPQSVPAITR